MRRAGPPEPPLASTPMPPSDAFADAFPVLRSTAYLNAGTCGPIPSASAAAIQRAVETGTNEGRGLPYYEALHEAADASRAAWGRLLLAPPHEIALTAGASDGIARTLAMIDWNPGDEIVTTDEEHPGLLGPLGALIRRYAVTVRRAPWGDVASAVSPATKLIAVSHVSWLRGGVIDLAPLTATRLPILIDGAQSAGAIPVDLGELRQQGVVAFAAAGQKWTCGPVGTGALWVDELWAPDHGIGVWPTYGELENPSAGLDATAWPDSRRFDTPSLSLEQLVGGLAALEVLEEHGWAAVHAAGVSGAARLASALADAGAQVEPRGPSTLVTWTPADAERLIERANAAGVVLRGFPDLPYVRASVGAWTTNGHLERLLALAAG